MENDKLKIYQNRRKDIFASLHKIKSKSENRKTGNMTGLYILPLSESPTSSIKGKRDSKQCLACLMSKSFNKKFKIDGTGTCYVNPVSTNSPWKSAKDLELTKPANFPKLTKPLRLGVYGEPAIIPLKILAKLVKKAPSHTGYTHAWEDISPKYSRFLMASIDDITAKAHKITSQELKERANKKGYRTFRIVKDKSELMKDEILCPYETKKIQCAKCKLCNGTYKGSNRKNIAVTIHGPQNKVKVYQRTLEA